MTIMKKPLLIFVASITFISMIILSACSGGQALLEDLAFIDEHESELEEDSVQGSHYTIDTRERIDTVDGDIDDEIIIGTDIKIDIEKTDRNNLTKGNENHIRGGVVKEENIDEEVLLENEPLLKETDNETISEMETLEKGYFVDKMHHTDHVKTDERNERIDPSIENTSTNKVEPERIRSGLGQVFKMSSEDKTTDYLFIQLIPDSGMSKTDIGRDALGMLLNSTNLVENAKDKIGKVDYVVIGAEISSSELWYFIASMGDLNGYRSGKINHDQLLNRIQIKKDMPNIFK